MLLDFLMNDENWAFEKTSVCGICIADNMIWLVRNFCDLSYEAVCVSFSIFSEVYLKYLGILLQSINLWLLVLSA